MLYPILEGPPLEAYNTVVQMIKARAMKELNLPDDQVIIRPLRPDDLGLTAEWTWATGTSAVWATYINAATIAQNRYAAIYGVVEYAGYASQLKITRGGSVARIWNIQPINNFANNVGYFDSPVTLNEGVSVTIEGYATTSGTTKLILLGVVAEKRGVVINP